MGNVRLISKKEFEDFYNKNDDIVNGIIEGFNVMLKNINSGVFIRIDKESRRYLSFNSFSHLSEENIDRVKEIFKEGGYDIKVSNSTRYGVPPEISKTFEVRLYLD